MKGLVLSLKPFKQKDRNILHGNISKEGENRGIQRAVSSGRGFFRDNGGSVSAGQPQEDFYTAPRAEPKPPERTEAFGAKGLEPSEGAGFYGYGGLQAVKDRERENLKKYGFSVVFAFVILLGVIAGTAASSGIDSGIMENIKFLMFTNSGAEGSNGSLQVFSSAFAVNFIYLTVIFLTGLSPWGMGVIPFVCLFKGFETGLIASYLGCTYEWGMTYYFLIIAPGIFVFAVSMIIQSGYSVRMSSALGKFMFTAQQDSGWIKENIRDYMYKSGSMMILATVAALVNTFMWSVCSNMFDL